MLKLIWSDPQIPYHHRKATSAMCTMLADRASLFDEVHQIGDLLDLAPLSQWTRGTPAENGKAVQKELDALEDWAVDLWKAAPGVHKTVLPGNHDDRLGKYLKTVAKGLDGLQGLTLENFTGLESYGWEWVKEPYRITKDTVAVHGLAVRSRSGYTGHAHIDKFFPTNVVHGHTHRGGIVYRTIGERTSWAMETGHTMDKARATYCTNPDWQMGFGVLITGFGEPTVPMFVPMKNDGSFVFDGKRWKG